MDADKRRREEEKRKIVIEEIQADTPETKTEITIL